MTGISSEELRIPAHNEAVMKQWDAWRAYIKTGGGGSWPRDAFEALLDGLDLERKLAANEIDQLRAEHDKLKARVTEVTCPECGVFFGMTDHDLDCAIGLKLERDWLPEGKWLWKNKTSIQALVEGRAAVVPLEFDGEIRILVQCGYEEYIEYSGVPKLRLDKPPEGK